MGSRGVVLWYAEMVVVVAAVGRPGCGELRVELRPWSSLWV